MSPEETEARADAMHTQYSGLVEIEVNGRPHAPHATLVYNQHCNATLSLKPLLFALCV